MNAFSNEIAIGTSAPPTGSTNSTPSASPTTASSHSNRPLELVTTKAHKATDETPAAIASCCPAGSSTGRVVISSCSFRNVTTDPEKLTAPISTVSTVASRNSTPESGTAKNSASATSAAAAPPTPLNSATICGMAVIFTDRAAGMPTTTPSSDGEQDPQSVVDDAVHVRGDDGDQHAERADEVAVPRVFG